MKSAYNLVALFVLFISLNARAELILKDYYYVESDVKYDSIKAGTCVLVGKVYEAYSEGPVGGAIISNLERSRRTTTDKNGEFKLLLSSKDTSVFFFHPKYKEIVCWNYDFKSQHLVTMNFVTSEKLPEGVIEVTEKPVIYLYSDKSRKLSIKADFAEDIDFSYPKYQNGWEVSTSTSGMVTSQGKEYPYIFWDGHKEGLGFEWQGDKLEGFQINTDTVTAFFENTLNSLGLNVRESTDFITYWAPRIKQFPYALVQFHIDENYDRVIGGLQLDPIPEVERRVFMLFAGMECYNQKLEVINPAFSGINREGLVLIEWGGSELESMTEAISYQGKQRLGGY
jgi:hypothetical protein